MCICACLWVCMCVCVNEAVWAYEHMCLCMAACQAVPSGCLTELLSLTGEVNCCGSAQAVSNTTLGTRRQQTIYMLVCVHAPTRARLCLKHKTRSGKPPAFFPPHNIKRLKRTRCTICEPHRVKRVSRRTCVLFLRARLHRCSDYSYELCLVAVMM